MNRSFMKTGLLALVLIVPGVVRAQQSASVAESEVKSPGEAAGLKAAAIGHVFGFPVSTKSAEAQKLLETALDQYENVAFDKASDTARRAAAADPQFALAYAVQSYATRSSRANPTAARRAEQLVPSAPEGEQLLIKFLLAVQKSDVLPAIAAMNDLLARFPEDRHALYLTAEWLYDEQDYDRSIKAMEHIIKLDPTFAPAYNMLGYANVEATTPAPEKAITYLKKYAELQPGNPNPEDSLGEVSRFAGDDLGALAHYRAALDLVPTFTTSRTGLGDTYTLMGDFKNAAVEYQKAYQLAANDHERLHVEYQEALMKFWQQQAEEGLQALAAAARDAERLNDPYAFFEIQEAHALLQPSAKAQLQALEALEQMFSRHVEGMNGSDRNSSLAAILRDEVRVHVGRNELDAAQEVVQKLEQLAASSRDLLVENCYESARGFLYFGQKDYANAADELSADPHSPIAFQWLAAAREKAGDGLGSEAALLRLKYLRGPSAEWYLVTQSRRSGAN